jgi:hypothetical protein
MSNEQIALEFAKLITEIELSQGTSIPTADVADIFSSFLSTYEFALSLLDTD